MAVSDAKRVVGEELDRVHEQISRLERALGHLGGSAQKRKGAPGGAPARASKRQGRPAAKGPRPQRTRKRISANERQEQMLAIVKMRPGISPSALAREAGVTPSYVGTIVKQLEADKKIRRADGGVIAQ